MASDESDKPWYADGLAFTCKQCHRCCRASQPGWVYTNPREALRIARRLELSEEQFRRSYLRQDPGGEMVLQVAPNGDCIFWQDGCSIYEVRPRQCRTFPFWPENLAEPADWEEATQQCAGAGSGRLYSLDEIGSVLHGRATGAAPREGSSGSARPQRTSSAVTRSLKS